MRRRPARGLACWSTTGDHHIAPLPVFRRHAGQPFPPRIALRGNRDIGEDRIVIEHRERIRIGLRTGARRDAEITRFRIDRPQAAIGTGRHPADIVADRPDFPACLAIALGRNQHRKIGLAAGRGERSCNVENLALRILDTDDQHVLGEPAFRPCLPRGDTQRVALLAEQRIAAVARTVRLDREFLGKMHDEAPVRIELADRMQALHEGVCPLAESGALGAFALEARKRSVAHARHDAHICDDVRTVGDLDTAARERRIDRAHAIGHDIQRAALHATGERIHLRMRVGRRKPVIVRAGIVLVLRADESQMLDPRHIGRMGAVQITVRMCARIEFDQIAAVEHQLDQRIVLRFTAVAPVDLVGLGEARGRFYPCIQACQFAAHVAPTSRRPMATR